MSQTNAAQGGKDFLLKLGNGFSGAVTFQNTGETVTQNGHGLENGDIVRFSAITGPTTIVINTNYFVVNKTANTFQVSATEGGSPINIDVDGTGTAVEVFRTMGGLRSTSFSFNGEAIDITSQDSGQWSEILNQAGIRSVSISGDGVFVDNFMFKKVHGVAFDQRLMNWQVVYNSEGDYYQGCFKVTSQELSGEYNAEATYSLSMESSGPITRNDT